MLQVWGITEGNVDLVLGFSPDILRTEGQMSVGTSEEE